VIGVDFSSQALAIAMRKSNLLQANATWIQADVLDILDIAGDLDGLADLVYTGKGALNWVSNLGRWATTIARLLRPGGDLYIYEGHPLNRVWDSHAEARRLADDGRSYFDSEPRANDDFPASAVARYTPPGETPPKAWEYPWSLGDVVTSVCAAGLVIERLQEHPDQFWAQFSFTDAELARLPHTFSLFARRP
jgi:SAM-dependent methyltransferase